LDWLGGHALADHRIEQADLDRVHRASDPGEVVQIVHAARLKQLHAARR